MATKHDLEQRIVEAPNELGGEAHLTRIAEHIWKSHEADLKASGDLFFTWQYDMRWAAQRLQQHGQLKKNSKSWSLS